MAPLVITFTNSFMSSKEVEKYYDATGDEYIEMNIIPEKVTLSQYGELLFDSPVYLNMFWNSVKIVIPIVLGQILVSAPAAYAFTILKFRGKEAVFFLYIVVMLLPLQVTLMPNYLVADWLNITDSYLAIILPGIFNPLGVFLLRQYMKNIPDAYIEAAKVDGAGNGRIFLWIVLPLVKPALAAAAMLTLLDYWNLVDQAVIFIQNTEAQPLSIFLAQINSGELGLAFAGSCFYAVPVLLVLFYGQEYLKSGIAITGLKG
jgi:multiple sugar transport system permease protein